MNIEDIENQNIILFDESHYEIKFPSEPTNGRKNFIIALLVSTILLILIILLKIFLF